MSGLSILVHGPAKAGKTTFAETSPRPRLVIDAEGGTRFTPSRKKAWNPATEHPPTDDGTWDTCVIYTRDYQTMEVAYQWLASGQHPFKSLVVDSLSEIQQRLVDQIAGAGRMEQQLWGDLLRQMSSRVRQMRDLIIHPTNPLEAVVLVAMTRADQKGKQVPLVQGQLKDTLPYYLDVTGYFYTEANPETGVLERKLLVSPQAMFEAGDRTGRLDPIVQDPNIEVMLNKIFGESHVTTPKQTTQPQQEEEPWQPNT